jgi:hypothetical protein
VCEEELPSIGALGLTGEDMGESGAFICAGRPNSTVLNWVGMAGGSSSMTSSCRELSEVLDFMLAVR